METIKFKTNIKCGGCIATVTPFLDGEKKISDWSVDLESADRILTVQTTETAADISQLVKNAGYVADEIA